MQWIFIHKILHGFLSRACFPLKNINCKELKLLILLEVKKVVSKLQKINLVNKTSNNF